MSSRFDEWASMPERAKRIPPELLKFIRFEDNYWKTCQWEGEALLTARGDKLEEIRGQLREKYDVNPVFDADTIYRLLDRIYFLEKRVKLLEQRQRYGG